MGKYRESTTHIIHLHENKNRKTVLLIRH